jgi:hypothetical protein
LGDAGFLGEGGLREGRAVAPEGQGRGGRQKSIEFRFGEDPGAGGDVAYGGA